MSWKSLVCAGLFCALAMPVMAAPTVTVDLVRSGGVPVLDANGDWQWQVSVTPDATDVSNGNGSMDAELAFLLTNAGLVSASVNGTDWDHDTPAPNPNTGTPAFGSFTWVTPTWPVGSEVYSEGLVMDTSADEVLASYGSINFGTATASQFLTIVTEGPSTLGSLTTSIEWGGAYGGNGRIAEAGVKHDTFAGSISKTAIPGDATLNGDVDGTDLSILLTHWPDAPGTSKWFDADFSGDGDVDGTDLSALLTHWPDPPAPLGALVGGAAVPEPASAMLLLVGSLLVVAGIRRR